MIPPAAASSATPRGRTSARARRARYGFTAIVLVAASTISMVLLNAIALRFAGQTDLTATAEHRLSPRSEALLRGLPAPYELVLSGPLRDPAIVPPRALEQVQDVIQRLARSSDGRLRSTTIDTGSASGATQFAVLIERLAERDAPRRALQSKIIEQSLETMGDAARALPELGRDLHRVRDAIVAGDAVAEANRRYLDLRGSELASNAGPLADLTERVRRARVAAEPTADLSRLSGQLRGPTEDLRAGLADISENLAKLSAAAAGAPDLRRILATAAQTAAGLRDRLASAVDELDRMPALTSARVAGALQASAGLLVIGPSEGPGEGLTALPIDALLTSGARADVTRTAEELLTTALASLAEPIKPIVVLVHGQSRGLFERVDWLDGLRARLDTRGIDLVLWETATTAEPPALTRLNPTGQRPVVYLVLNTAAFASSGRAGDSGADRAKRLGAAVEQLLDSGASMLINLYPSTLPTFGEPDPVTAPLADLGIIADTGRTILRERMTPEGRRVDAVQRLRADNDPRGTNDASIATAAPIVEAVRGLPMKFEWPVAIDLSPASASATVLYTINDNATWAESQWLSYIQIPPAQHAMVPDPPSPDAARDGRGPFIVAGAAERQRESRRQRVIVVGTNSWFLGPTLDESTVVDGRAVPANPGNVELLDAAISWLAGQEHLIGASPTARALPVVKSLDETTLRVIRLTGLVLLPVGVLALGVIWRWARP